MLKRSKYSPRYRTIEQARAWAYDQEFDDVWYLIHNIEEDKYQLVNDSRLYYLYNIVGDCTWISLRLGNKIKSDIFCPLQNPTNTLYYIHHSNNRD